MRKENKELKVIKKVIDYKRVKVKNGKNRTEEVGESIYYKRPNGTIGIKYVSKGKTKTIESQGPDVDIKNIVKRLQPHQVWERYVFDENEDNVIDVSGYRNYHDSLNQVAAADSQFMRLPSNVRGFFDNDKTKFVDYCVNATTDNKKMAKLVELGLAKQVNIPQEEVKKVDKTNDKPKKEESNA